MKKFLTTAAAVISLVAVGGIASAQDTGSEEKPNILVIWGDDIGWQNLSSYGLGTMAIPRPISTGLPMKAFVSPITMPNPAARPVARPLSPGNIRSVQA